MKKLSKLAALKVWSILRFILAFLLSRPKKAYGWSHRALRRGILYGDIAILILVILLGGMIYQCRAHISEGAQWAASETKWAFNRQALSILRQPDKALTFEGALRFAKEIDEYKDKVWELMPQIQADENGLLYLAIEIVPYFYYEGISNPIEVCFEASGNCYAMEGSEVHPQVMQWIKYENTDHFHIGGQAGCRTDFKFVVLNVQYINPYSGRSMNDARVVSIVAHELAHINGICDDHSYMESATQIATAEVLASMTNYRSPYGLIPFLETVQDFAEDFAWHIALRDHRMDEFMDYIRSTARTSYNVASTNKSLRFWSGPRRPRLKEILSLYGRVPYILLVEALNDPDLYTRQISSFPNFEHRISLNDTEYVLSHLDELVRDYHMILNVHVKDGFLYRGKPSQTELIDPVP